MFIRRNPTRQAPTIGRLTAEEWFRRVAAVKELGLTAVVATEDECRQFLNLLTVVGVGPLMVLGVPMVAADGTPWTVDADGELVT